MEAQLLIGVVGGREAGDNSVPPCPSFVQCSGVEVGVGWCNMTKLRKSESAGVSVGWVR